MKALSVIAPFGTMIASLKKKLEIRKWIPDGIPLRNVLLIEHRHKLTEEFSAEIGKAVAIIDIDSIKKWEKSDLIESCCSKYEEGYYAWKISNVRIIEDKISIIAKRKMYNIEVKADKQIEQNYQIGNGLATVSWNINKVKKHLENNRHHITKVKTESAYAGINRDCIDKAYALTTNETEPVIIVELENNKEIIIDGNHRIYKNHLLASSYIKAVFLPIEEHKIFINDFDEKTYNNVINVFSKNVFERET